MACPSNMFKISEQEGGGVGGGFGGGFFTNPSLIGPRISFSHDFTDTVRHELGSYKEAPVSSDFEFSVNDYAMIPADEIFFKGAMVPPAEDQKSSPRKTTLKDELLMGDNDDDGTSGRDVFSGFRRTWRVDQWGSKKSNHHMFGSKKGGKRSGSIDGMLLETVVEEKAPKFVSYGEALITTIIDQKNI